MERKVLPEANHNPVISRETEQRRWAFVFDEACISKRDGSPLFVIGGILAFVILSMIVVALVR